MNRLSELQTIVKVSNICNKNGLIKEADQLLNIFTKLAQENPETDAYKPEAAEPEVVQPEVVQPEVVQPEVVQPEVTVDKELESQLKDFVKSSDEMLNSITEQAKLEDIKKLAPELSRIVDLARVIYDNPNLDEYNKKILSESLPELLKLQEVLDK